MFISPLYYLFRVRFSRYMKYKLIIILSILYSLFGSIVYAESIYTQQMNYQDKIHNDINIKKLGLNIIDGTNVLIQSMVNEINTIYIITEDYDLNGLEIILPTGCTLDFQGGSLKNGSIVFNNTKLTGNVLLSSLSSLNGLPSEIEASWFNIRPCNKDNSNLLNQLIDLLPEKEVYTIKFESGVYKFESPIYIRSRINFIGKSYVHGSDYWVNDNRDECVFLFNHEEYGIISDNNTTGVNTFKNITFRAGNENSGGCNFISELGASSYNYNLLFEHCNFNGFKHKFGLRISDCWRSNINTCHFIGCGGAIGIIKGSTGENNDIMIFQCTIEECCVGIYGSGLLRNINIIGGTIEGIRSKNYKTTFPNEIKIPQYVLKKLSVKEQGEIRTAVLVTGTMIGVIEGVYFEANEGIDLFFSYESVVNIIGCTFNDTFLKAEPIINGFCNSLNIQGNIFYINKNREHSTFIIDANIKNLIFIGNDTHGLSYKNLVNKENISKYFMQDSNGKFYISNIIEEIKSGDKRPILNSKQIGYLYFDTILQKPIWWTGFKWVDANGKPI